MRTLPDPTEAFVDEIFGRVPTVDLAQQPRHVPTDVERWYVMGALQEAQDALALPRMTVRFVWSPGESRGQASREGATFLVTINYAEIHSGAEAREVAFHEAQHIADLSDGTWDRSTRAENERRAVAFANTMMSRQRCP
jgi:hypothetical protein